MDDKNESPLVTPEDIKNLESNKLEALSLEKNKKGYIKEMVFKFGPLWWEHLEKDLQSKDKELHRTAMMEFNKLQSRVLPTEITGADGNDLVVNIVQWTKPKQIEDESN